MGLGRIRLLLADLIESQGTLRNLLYYCIDLLSSDLYAFRSANTFDLLVKRAIREKSNYWPIFVWVVCSSCWLHIASCPRSRSAVSLACLHLHSSSTVLICSSDYAGVKLRDPSSFKFVWIEDFPLFLPKEDGSPGIFMALLLFRTCRPQLIIFTY